jgi:hypothetical protein
MLVEEFSRCGVETIFLRSAGGDNPEERLLLQFQGMIAEYERAQIIERSRRGKRHRAKMGCINVLSGAPYGYRYVRKTDTSEAYYAVIEAEAEVVREVFEFYAKELWSIGAITRHLNERGIRTRLGRGPLLVCGQCGYGLYRTSTKTSKGQLQYYRCLGSDRYRHLRGPRCQCRPIRQDYLDELIWQEVLRLLNEPELVRAEIERRIQENLSSDPVQQRKLRLERESKRIASQLDKLLDAYQEDLIGLTDLRTRVPELRRKQTAIEKELQGVALQALEKTRLTQLNASIENFLSALHRSAKNLDVLERQKIVRLVIKQVILKDDTLTIQHSIPVSRSNQGQPRASYLLCTRSICGTLGIQD